MRFSSIEAAVSSLSTPDPAALDFDGSDVDSARRVQRRSLRAPSQAEIEAAAQSPPPELAEIDALPDETGDFASTPAVRLLYRLAVEKATGLLVVELGPIRKEIYIRAGDPEFVSSNVAGELFGSYLVGQGVIASGELDMALAMMPSYGGKLGDTLVGLGLMKPLDVFRHLSQQVRDKLIDVCTWERGGYSWFADYENPRESFPLDLRSFEVLGAGAMAITEAGILSWAETIAHRSPKSAKNPALRPDHFQIGDWALRVYDMLDGSKTVWELAGRYTEDADRLDFLRVLFLLVQTDLAAFTG
jgi:serine/threonine-protein kinase